WYTLPQKGSIMGKKGKVEFSYLKSPFRKVISLRIVLFKNFSPRILTLGKVFFLELGPIWMDRNRIFCKDYSTPLDYTMKSEIPLITPSRAHYISLAHFIYLQVPQRLKSKLNRFTWHIVKQYPSPILKVQALVRHLRSHYSYSLDAPTPKGIDPTEYFLLSSKKGYCQHFASALALMLRSVGIPARVCIGFRGSDYDPHKETLEITNKMGHAWVEAKIGPYGWITLDGTPSASSAEPGKKEVPAAGIQGGGKKEGGKDSKVASSHSSSRTSKKNASSSSHSNNKENPSSPSTSKGPKTPETEKENREKEDNSSSYLPPVVWEKIRKSILKNHGKNQSTSTKENSRKGGSEKKNSSSEDKRDSTRPSSVNQNSKKEEAPKKIGSLENNAIVKKEKVKKVQGSERIFEEKVEKNSNKKELLNRGKSSEKLEGVVLKNILHLLLAMGILYFVCFYFIPFCIVLYKQWKKPLEDMEKEEEAPWA
ncbi:MAG: transglutaminase domain-containing protein, partial [Planctomycetota bacterium]